MVRIIPAYAGKRVDTSGKSLVVEDHPRLRGEKGYRTAWGHKFKGSSPLTRGKAITFHCRGLGKGIIPAYAGKRSCGYHLLRSQRDHPRLRGEKTQRGGGPVPQGRSSPLTRGKDGLDIPIPGGARIIPAYAGKSISKIAQKIK